MSRYFAGSPSQAVLDQQGKGRPKGSINKTHAVVRWGLVEAYRRLGGVEGLVKWGKRNRTEFYQLLGKLIPAEIADQHGTGDNRIQVVVLPANSPQGIASTDKPLETIPAQEQAGVLCRQAGVAEREPEA